MGAPLGNKYALGNKGGRPREYNRDEIAQMLFDWSATDDAMYLIGFCADYAIDPQYLNDWAKENKEFSLALKTAKMRIAKRQRERLHDKENPYNYGLFMREHSHYDSYLRACEREDKQFESDLRKAEQAQVAPQTQEAFDALMKQISELQSELSALRAAAKSESKAAQS